MPVARGNMTSSSVLRAAPRLARVPHRSFLSLFGSQAPEFLNGVLATPIREPRRPGFSTVLNAQGRVLYDIFLFAQKDDKGKPGYILEFDSRPSEATPLLELLKRYVLRSKVKIRDVSEEYDLWAAWGQNHWQWAQSGAVEPIWSPEGEWPWGTQDGVIRDRRAVGMGKRILARQGDKPRESQDHDLVDSYTAHRLSRHTPTQAFPMDCNLDMMGGLDFRKGCYVGQELTVRTYHTGVLRKRIYPASITSGGRRPTGKLLTSEDGRGLALLRIELVDAQAQFQVKDEAGGVWNVKPTRPDWWPQSTTPSDTSIG
ncbi:hypothetical protein CPB85DRAFT_1292511 [Mucidula mucida]|nr:hypothetical protein CPB85DRAFT_1292511 [Mucidula mucida]